MWWILSVTTISPTRVAFVADSTCAIKHFSPVETDDSSLRRLCDFTASPTDGCDLLGEFGTWWLITSFLFYLSVEFPSRVADGFSSRVAFVAVSACAMTLFPSRID